MLATRTLASLVLVVLGTLSPPVHAAKTPQEKEFAAKCANALTAIDSASKARLSAFAAQIDAYGKAVATAQKTPTQSIDLVVAETADCLADVLQFAVDETLEVRETAVTLLGELGSVRPVAFQAGAGSTLDKYHVSVTKRLEKTRARVEKTLREYISVVDTATDGQFVQRLVVPSLGQFVLADPNPNDASGSLDDDMHPSRLLVLMTGAPKNNVNTGRLVVAGQSFFNPFDPIKPDIAISVANAHPQTAASMDQRGVWQTSFANLAPANLQVWVEEDDSHSSAIGDAGSLLIQVIYVP